MDGVVYLIQKIYKEDAIGQRIPDVENRLELFAAIESVSRREWAEAGRNGLKPEIKITTAAINYSGEKEIEYNGTRYSVYRTYHLPESDQIELYLERKAGVQ